MCSKHCMLLPEFNLLLQILQGTGISLMPSYCSHPWGIVKFINLCIIQCLCPFSCCFKEDIFKSFDLIPFSLYFVNLKIVLYFQNVVFQILSFLALKYRQRNSGALVYVLESRGEGIHQFLGCDHHGGV